MRDRERERKEREENKERDGMTPARRQREEGEVKYIFWQQTDNETTQKQTQTDDQIRKATIFGSC